MDPKEGSSISRKKRILKETGVQLKKVLKKKNEPNVKNKRVLIKKRVPSKKRGKKKVVMKCDHCKKKFDSVSAKNVHVESKHKGRRFICPLCDEDFHSKFAYDRHLDRKHKDRKEATKGAENAVYIAEKIEMTPAAKDALIQRLRTENEEKDRQIAKYKLKITELEERSDQINNICANVLGHHQSSHASSHNPNFELNTSQPSTSSKLLPTAAIHTLEQWITENLASGNLICDELAHGADLLELTHQDLNHILKCFIEGVRKPNNGLYAPDTVYNLILAIQKYLYENDRNGNIFLDPQYIGVAESLNKVLEKFHSMHEGLSK